MSTKIKKWQNVIFFFLKIDVNSILMGVFSCDFECGVYIILSMGINMTTNVGTHMITIVRPMTPEVRRNLSDVQVFLNNMKIVFFNMFYMFCHVFSYDSICFPCCACA